MAGDRDKLLNEIASRPKLRPTVTVDKSKPIILADGEAPIQIESKPGVKPPPAPPIAPSLVTSIIPPPPPSIFNGTLPKSSNGSKGFIIAQGKPPDRDALLNEIKNPRRLNKVQTVDKSKPIFKDYSNAGEPIDTKQATAEGPSLETDKHKQMNGNLIHELNNRLKQSKDDGYDQGSRNIVKPASDQKSPRPTSPPPAPPSSQHFVSAQKSNEQTKPLMVDTKLDRPTGFPSAVAESPSAISPQKPSNIWENPKYANAFQSHGQELKKSPPLENDPPVARSLKPDLRYDVGKARNYFQDRSSTDKVPATSPNSVTGSESSLPPVAPPLQERPSPLSPSIRPSDIALAINGTIKKSAIEKEQQHAALPSKTGGSCASWSAGVVSSASEHQQASSATKLKQSGSTVKAAAWKPPSASAKWANGHIIDESPSNGYQHKPNDFSSEHHYSSTLPGKLQIGKMKAFSNPIENETFKPPSKPIFEKNTGRKKSTSPIEEKVAMFNAKKVSEHDKSNQLRRRGSISNLSDDSSGRDRSDSVFSEHGFVHGTLRRQGSIHDLVQKFSNSESITSERKASASSFQGSFVSREVNTGAVQKNIHKIESPRAKSNSVDLPASPIRYPCSPNSPTVSEKKSLFESQNGFPSKRTGTAQLNGHSSLVSSKTRYLEPGLVEARSKKFSDSTQQSESRGGISRSGAGTKDSRTAAKPLWDSPNGIISNGKTFNHINTWSIKKSEVEQRVLDRPGYQNVESLYKSRVTKESNNSSWEHEENSTSSVDENHGNQAYFNQEFINQINPNELNKLLTMVISDDDGEPVVSMKMQNN